MRHAIRIAVIAALATAPVLLAAASASADDAHQTCSGTVVCTGNILDTHGVLVPLLSPVLLPVVPVAAP